MDKTALGISRAVFPLRSEDARFPHSWRILDDTLALSPTVSS
ncbi:hypothetical protein [Scytonema sp. NUACC21]